MERSTDADVLVIGAGILGVTIAYWLSGLYDCTIAIADTADFAAAHTSSRNTGVIHRPFYLNPQTKRVFARTSLVSHPMWQSLAQAAGLPWRPIGTFNVGLDEAEVRILERYRDWGVENGMSEQELELLDGKEVQMNEPEVRCKAGLISKTDVSVDFGIFTRHLWKFLMSRGVKFLGGHRVTSVHEKGKLVEIKTSLPSGHSSIRCKILVNAAGGGALEIAHSCGLALEYASLNFRGEYWVVDEPFASRVTSNIYRPPKFPQYPFLDPHFVVRSDGTRQIGPNAVVVPGPYVYTGIGLTKLAAFLDRPMEPKGKLLMNGDFLSLLAGEWRSSLSKRAMCERVRKFVPALDTGMLSRRAVFGVRSSVINSSGFVPEAVLLRGEASAHIINFNSPGATGAPAYSAFVVGQLRRDGLLDGLVAKAGKSLAPGWDFQAVTAQL
jgi:(S)-2-hydroxyglutarate dehydrogenase